MKEQKQQLNKIQIPTTQLGKVESSAGGNTPTIAPIAPDKSNGERLAAALDITVKAGAHIYEQVDEQKTAFDVIEATAAATEYTSHVLNEAAELSDEAKKQDLYAKKTKEFFNGYKGLREVSNKAFIAGTGVVSKVFGNATQESVARQTKNTIADMQEKTRGLIETTITSNTALNGVERPDGEDIVKFIKDSIGLNFQEASKFYLDTAISTLATKVQNDYADNKPITLDTYSSWINTYLKIKTKDGIKYENHPVYGSLIRNFEDSISKLAAVQAKQNEGRLYMNMYTDFYTLKVSDIEGITKARKLITANINNLSPLEFEKLHKLLTSVEKGETIIDNQVNLDNAYMEILKYNRKPDAAFFDRFNIRELDNKKFLVGAYEKPDKGTDATKADFLRILGTEYKMRFAYDTVMQKKSVLVTKIYLGYLRKGKPSYEAYELAKKDVPVEDAVKAPPKPININTLKNPETLLNALDIMKQ